MRICDRCESRARKTTLLNKQNGNEYDLCHKCSADFDEFIANKPNVKEEKKEEVKRRGRPPKEKEKIDGTN
jgi:hypothetical protein